MLANAAFLIQMAGITTTLFTIGIQSLRPLHLRKEQHKSQHTPGKMAIPLPQALHTDKNLNDLFQDSMASFMCSNYF
jgi:hypothetical protein